MFRIITGLVIIALVVILILFLCGVFKSKDDKSPISKDGKKIDKLELDQAIETLKKNGFKQSDEELKNILAVSYIFAGMSKEDQKAIVDGLENKKGNKEEGGASTKEGSSSDKEGSSSKAGSAKSENKSSSKDKSSNRKSEAKIEKVNKDYKKDVFGHKDGVDRVLSDDYKNKNVKNLLMSLKEVDSSQEPTTLKSKVPNYKKIIKRANLSRVDKDNKDMDRLGANVLQAFVGVYEKILNNCNQDKNED